ncbi:sugar kinase [Pseudarthrobacter sp. DSP2-3-2b1]|uniref:sugar kinase n=1 Tax=Pseudarthrobacter sp. DSP2-3-2b1 TaxID=2804661 RepID=UPI003CFBBF69
MKAIGQPYALTIGETMALMSSSVTGPLAHAASLSLGIGGSESNVAIGLQRLGAQAVWCSRLGDDSLGQLVEREIRAEGVDVRVRIDPHAPTGLMIKERRTATAQRVTYYRAGSAASHMSPDDIDDELIANAAVVHLSGITPALSAQAADTVRKLVADANAAGVPISFDLNYRANLWSINDAASFYREILPKVDIVFAGEDEAAIAIGPATDPAELASRLTALGPRETVIKLGSEGALAIIDGELFQHEAIPVDVVDTVGAGDAFVAGYLAERLQGCSPQERLLTAVTTGAFACLVPGDWEGLPRRADFGLLQAKEPVAR